MLARRGQAQKDRKKGPRRGGVPFCHRKVKAGPQCRKKALTKKTAFSRRKAEYSLRKKEEESFQGGRIIKQKQKKRK